MNWASRSQCTSQVKTSEGIKPPWSDIGPSEKSAGYSWQSEAVRFFRHSVQPNPASVFQTCWKLACWARNILPPSEYWLWLSESRFTVEILSTEDQSARCRPTQHFSRMHLWGLDRTLPLQGSGSGFVCLKKSRNKLMFLSHCIKKERRKVKRM